MRRTDDCTADAVPAVLLTSDDMVCCPPVVLFYQSPRDAYDKWVEEIQWCVLMRGDDSHRVKWS